MANPHELLVSIRHSFKLTRRLLSDHEIAARLESLFLSHDEPDLLFSSVSQKFGESDAPLFPLVISESEQLDPLFVDALLSFSSAGEFHIRQVFLGIISLWIRVVDVVLFFFFWLRFHLSLIFGY